MSQPISFRLHTYGCKVNTYDSGLLQSRLEKSGFIENGEAPQVHILNTCAVTREATQEAVKTARKLKAKSPFSLVVVTGCAAQVDTEEFTHVQGVDLVVANSHKGQLENLVRQYYAGLLKDRVHKSNIFKKEDLEEGGGVEPGHTRAFLKIQDGCDSFCTFCVIPFARGKSRSLSIADLVHRIRELEIAGVKEVVLTGVHIADYNDNGKVLEDLVEAVLLKTRVPRIRLSSLEPGEVSERLLEFYKDPRMCPHFHMSIQAAHTRVLQAMKRRYSAEQVAESLHSIHERVPGVYVGMDVIAGFPGETDEEFTMGAELLGSLPWTRLHVFPYSPRPGTYATRLDGQMNRDKIKRRAEILRNLSTSRLVQAGNGQIGSVKKALVLGNGQMLSRDYWPVESENPLLGRVNQELAVEITGFLSGKLLGRPVDAMPL